jgi:hypothetical protein
VHSEVYIFPEEEDERKAGLQASYNVLDQAFEPLNPARNGYIYEMKDSNDASMQLVAKKAGNLWRYEPFVGNVTGPIVGVEYNAHTPL